MPFSRPLEDRGSGAQFFSPGNFTGLRVFLLPVTGSGGEFKASAHCTKSTRKASFQLCRLGRRQPRVARSVAASTGTGSAPTDLALSDNSRFLYALNSGNRTISCFRVQADGSLTPVTSATGLPAGAVAQRFSRTGPLEEASARYCEVHCGNPSSVRSSHGDLEMRSRADVHDRAIFLDQRGWVIGQSLKDAARKKPTYMIELNEPSLRASRDVHNRIWALFAPRVARPSGAFYHVLAPPPQLPNRTAQLLRLCGRDTEQSEAGT